MTLNKEEVKIVEQLLYDMMASFGEIEADEQALFDRIVAHNIEEDM